MRNRDLKRKAGSQREKVSGDFPPPKVAPPTQDKIVTVKEPFYKVNTIYSLTLNPENKYQFINKGAERRACICKVYEDLMDDKDWEYFLKMELSEPRGMLLNGHQGARYHFHGWIVFKSVKHIVHFLDTTIRQLCAIGTLDIDLCNDPKIWKEYCLKQSLIKKSISSVKIQTNTNKNILKGQDLLDLLIDPLDVIIKSETPGGSSGCDGRNIQEKHIISLPPTETGRLEGDVVLLLNSEEFKSKDGGGPPRKLVGRINNTRKK